MFSVLYSTNGMGSINAEGNRHLAAFFNEKWIDAELIQFQEPTGA